MQAVMTTKGQITVPAFVRNRLNLRTGDALDFVCLADDRVELVPMRLSVKALKGLVPKPARPVTLAEMDRAVGRGGEP